MNRRRPVASGELFDGRIAACETRAMTLRIPCAGTALECSGSDSGIARPVISGGLTGRPVVRRIRWLVGGVTGLAGHLADALGVSWIIGCSGRRLLPIAAGPDGFRFDERGLDSLSGCLFLRIQPSGAASCCRRETRGRLAWRTTRRIVRPDNRAPRRCRRAGRVDLDRGRGFAPTSLPPGADLG